jgi:hypothetical protein
MKKLFTSIFLVLTLSSVTVLAQVGGNFNSNDLQSFSVYNTINENGKVIDLDNLDGSIYLNEEFEPGLVIDTSKDQELKAMLRYNIFKDQVEINLIKKKDEISVLKRSTNYEYILNGDRIKLFFNDKIFRGGKDNGYLFILGNTSFEGQQVNLYKKYYQNYTPPKKASSTYVQPKPASLENASEYYISEDGKNFNLVEANRRNILDAFDSKYRSDLKDFIKSKNFKFRGNDIEVENEIKRLVYFYNTLR